MRYLTKTILIALILVNLFHVNTNAQQTARAAGLPDNRQRCDDIAFKNLADLKNARLDYKAAEARNKEFTGLHYRKYRVLCREIIISPCP
jgi:hypothetical protein